jgi:hypothetical protein
MEVRVGDEVIVDGRHMDDLPRKGEVLEVLSRGDVAHYRILWDDGTDCIFFPASDAHFVHPGQRSPKKG